MAVAIHEAASSASLNSLGPSNLDQLVVSTPEARIDDSPAPSVGIRAAAEMGDNDERETWRSTARDWYALGLKDTPGAGRLQHHLGTLCRDVKGDELRAVYHFSKRYVSCILSYLCGIDRLIGFVWGMAAI